MLFRPPSAGARPCETARMLDVCICTHDPRPGVLREVLASVAAQTAGAGAFRVLVVDNASTPPLAGELIGVIENANLPVRMVREPKLGIAQARYRAICETTGQWTLFVDDDNVLAPSFVEEGLNFIAGRKDIGCFGGKLLLPPDIEPPSFALSFLPFLGIRDLGNETVIVREAKWTRWVPPAAGAFVHRRLLDVYRQVFETGEGLNELGRKGRGGLGSCEDALLMSFAFDLGLDTAYVPSLVLSHRLDPRRFRIPYLMRLMYGYGRSHAVLYRLTHDTPRLPPAYASPHAFLSATAHNTKDEMIGRGLVFGLSRLGYHLAAWKEHRRLAASDRARGTAGARDVRREESR